MSICDVCHSPGACCRGMVISGGSFDKNLSGKKLAWIRREWRRNGQEFPFRMSGRYHSKGIPRMNCPRVDSHGRCTIYMTRPELCRSFEATSDPLCVYGRKISEKIK